MKKLLLLVVPIFIIVSVLSANQITTFGWEDPALTVLYNEDPSNSHFENTDEIAHSGSRSLKTWIDPLEPPVTSNGYVAWITNLEEGDSVYASVWCYDTIPGDYPKGRLSFLRTMGDNYPTSMIYGDQMGESNYTTGIGWEQISDGVVLESQGGMYDGIAIQIVDYAYSEGNGSLLYFDDFTLEVSSDGAEIMTLPVELSSFTAVYANDFVTIQWATASETDVLGFNIYRAYENNFENAKKVNMSMISGHGTTTESNEYSFVDETADAYFGTYYYWLESVNYGGTTNVYGSIQYEPVDIDGDGQLNTIVHSSLNNVFPNPVRVGQSVTFEFMIGGLEGTMRPVSLNIYDIKGRLVQEVINEDMMVNDYSKNWHVNDLANGVYFYQLKTANYQETKKLIIQ